MAVPMNYTTLGRTGLNVSVAGLGCGGPSRLGMATGRSEEESIAVVRAALDAGVNLLDTAEVYGTEEIVGKAIAGRRDDAVIATKAWWQNREGALRSRNAVRHALEASLQRLGTDRVEVYFLHGVTPDVYEEVRNALVPTLKEFQDEGKVRFIGVTEHFGSDTRHVMLQRALQDDWIDVVMLGFSLLNQCARNTVLPVTQEKGVGTLDMFAVRRALSRPDEMRRMIDELTEQGLLDGDLDPEDPLGFLVHEGGAVSVVDAAYRFCRDEPGIDVVLTGTGDVGHLRENVASLERPPLPDADTERLRQIFARVDSVSGN
jgi:aryl-alcohol dehydrogenase-like predicted oxidoreductase